MESATGSRLGRFISGAALAAVMMFGAAALLFPVPLQAAHRAAVGNDGGACDDCHTLNSADGAQEPNSAYLMYGSRTLTNMRAAFGGSVPKGSYGCTYCHNNPTNTEMKGVLNHFSSVSRHPMGETFNGFGAARTNTDNEWKSNFAGDTSAATKELDCVDCHDIGLLDNPDDPLLGHVTTAHPTLGTDRTNNPYMLIGVTAPGEYDAFCRTCHGAAATPVKTVNLRLVSHNDASDTGANAIKESDTTPIKTGANTNAQCSACHKGHGSTGKKLFVETLDPSDGTKCTDCHQNGDIYDNFEKHGHGKNTSYKNNPINFDCTNCHAVNSAHDPSNSSINSGNPKMLNATEDTSTSVYGKSLRSICTNCHNSSTYTAHSGTGGTTVGCIDCHDEHAEGSGTTSNNYMIPQNLPNNHTTPELSFFRSANNDPVGKYDYWVDDGDTRKTAEGPLMAAENNAGVCDNSVCHGAGTPMGGQPLDTFLGGGGHTGPTLDLPTLQAGIDCSSCHKHTDAGGSWAASESCTDCHGQPPVSQATSASGYVFSSTPADEAKTPHTRHATTANYGFACTECHAKNNDTPPHNEGTPSYASVWFNTATNPDAQSYPTAGIDYVDATYTCNNLYCHSDGQQHQAGGSQRDGVVWMTSATTPDWSAANLLCSDCHGASNNTVGSLNYGAPDHANPGPTANSHDKHPYACAVCHNLTTQDTDPAGGWTLDLAGKKHVNGVKDLLQGGGVTFSPNAPGTPRTCNTISCHGNGNATWGAGSLTCDQCHFSAVSDTDDWTYGNGTAAIVNSTEWADTGHGRPGAANYMSNNVEAKFAGPASDPQGCFYCHDGAVTHATGTNPFRLGNKSTLGRGATEDNGWNDVCLVCHRTGDAGFNPGAGYVLIDGAKDVDENHYGSKHAGFPTRGGTFCWDCHDPHGDAQPYMMHSGAGVTRVSDGLYGVPSTREPVTDFVLNVRDNGVGDYTSGDLANAATTGLCQTCHTAANYYNQTTFTALSSHNGADATRCTSCHKHTDDFGASCSGCHGNSATGQIWPDGANNTDVGKTTPDNNGAHERHMEALAQRVFGMNTAALVVSGTANQKQLCEYCHAAVTNDDDHGVNANLPADVFDALMPAAQRFAKNFQGGADADATYTPGTWTCTNVDCHYKTTATPSWYLGAPAAPTAGSCTTCHNNGTDNGAIANAIPAAGKHPQHGAAYTITTCEDCHTGYTPAAMTAVATMTTHINGSLYEVAIPNGAGAYKSQSALADPAYSGGATGTCSDVSCHGGQSIAWNAATPTCTNCHKVETTPTEYNSATSGLHGRAGSVSLENHTGADGSSGDFTDSSTCNQCHNAPTNHYVGLNTIGLDAVNNFATTYNGTGGSITNTACAVICHSDTDQGPNPDVPRWARKWSATVTNTDGTECVNCHGLWGSWSTGVTHRTDSGPANQHGSPTTAPTFGCDECHGWNSAQYDFSPKWNAPPGSMHGDEVIQLNSNGSNAARLTGVDAGKTGCSVCHSANDGTAAGQHSFDTVSRWGFATIADGAYSGCTGCHGSTSAGTNGQGEAVYAGQFWPDGTGGTPAYADDEPGAHFKHVNAIAAARGWTTVDQKNQTCDWCHANPGQPRPGTYTGSPESTHSIDSQGDTTVDVIGDGRLGTEVATFYNNAATRSADADGAYDPVQMTCSNIDCHGGTTTPPWTGGALPDTTSPTWPGGVTGIAGTDLTTGGAVNVTWNTATDAYPSDPVRYDLFWSTVSGNVFTSPVGTMTNLTATSANVTGLNSGTPYFFGVRAKDSWTPPNGETNTQVSISVTPTAPSGGSPISVGSTTINGTQATATDRSYFSASNAATGDGNIDFISMDIAAAGTGTMYVYVGTWTGTSWTPRSVVTLPAPAATGVYTFSAPADFAAFPVVAGDYIGYYTAAGGPTISRQTSGASTWYTGAGVNAGIAAVPTGWTELTVRTLDLYATGTGGAPADTTPPTAFTMISVTDLQTDGELQISWNASTDADSPPVTYDVYRDNGSVADACTTGATVATNYGATSYVDSGLTNTNTYSYCIRAKDNVSPTPNTRNSNTLTGSPTLGGGGGGPLTCTSCHDTAPFTGAHQKHANNDADYTDCDKCHGNATYSVSVGYTTSGPAGVHNNGSSSMFFGRIPGETDAAYNDVASPGDTCTNVNCHGNSTTPSWTTGVGGCDMCHGYPPTSASDAANNKHIGTAVNHDTIIAGNTTALLNNHDECGVCHGTKDDGFGAHAPYTAPDTYDVANDHTDGSIEMNGPTGTGSGYNEVNFGCDNACHGNDGTHDLSNSGLPVEFADYGGGSCDGCHGPGGSGPTVVYPTGSGAPAQASTAYGSHLKALNADTINGTTDWSLQCGKCHNSGGTFHADGLTGTNDVEISTRHSGTTAVPTMNEQYPGHGYLIKLGGTGTTANNRTTEAELCWDCHTTNGISEWGTNTKAATGSMTYNYGSVSTPNWTTATWSPASANFNYKVAAIKSTHSVNWDLGSAAVSGTMGTYTESVDPAVEIRCSYCHDVHDTRPVGTGEVAADVTGPPYLRGSWRGNPYAEDGAPYNKDYTSQNLYGPVPRAGTAYTESGGYFIDQNSTVTPTTLAWSAMQFGGLCEKCHANNDGAFTAAEIAGLDEVTGEGLWTSTNGHANSVKDSTGTGGANIFDFSRGRPTAVEYTSKSTNNVAYSQGLQEQLAENRGYGYRSGTTSGARFLPTYQGSRAFAAYDWPATVDGTTTQSLFHKFSCSKCHNPHASRLPKLLITNCLDINHNTWDDAKGSVNNYYTGADNGERNAYWFSAQNCHRADDINGTNDGWNKVSPWGGAW